MIGGMSRRVIEAAVATSTPLPANGCVRIETLDQQMERAFGGLLE